MRIESCTYRLIHLKLSMIRSRALPRFCGQEPLLMVRQKLVVGGIVMREGETQPSQPSQLSGEREAAQEAKEAHEAPPGRQCWDRAIPEQDQRTRTQAREARCDSALENINNTAPARQTNQDATYNHSQFFIARSLSNPPPSFPRLQTFWDVTPARGRQDWAASATELHCTANPRNSDNRTVPYITLMSEDIGH